MDIVFRLRIFEKVFEMQFFKYHKNNSFSKTFIPFMTSLNYFLDYSLFQYIITNFSEKEIAIVLRLK